MASLNTRRPAMPPQGGLAPRQFEPSNTLRTHEGAPAAEIPLELQLRRSVCSCLLWEDTYYENGQEIASRITDLARAVPPKIVADLAMDARTHFHLRHVPLLLCAVLAKTGPGTSLVSNTIAETIQRADELTEFLAVYAKVNGVGLKNVRRKLSAQVKKGLARAFNKFDQYQLAKYFSASREKDAVIRGRDVMFLTHPVAKDADHATLFRQIANKEKIREGGAETWETGLSRAGSDVDDKRVVWENLLRDQKLGYMALLRNLRNMTAVNVDGDLIRAAIVARRGARNVLPFRYVAAARACPTYETELDQALLASVESSEILPGDTAVLIDVSRSMDHKISAKSDLTRMDAAATLAAVLHCERIRLFTFSDECVEVQPSTGLLGVIEAIKHSQPHQGTQLGAAIRRLMGLDRRASGRYRQTPEWSSIEPVKMDRLICVTDEQSYDLVHPAGCQTYVINVASYRNGVGYGQGFVHLDGFSEQILKWIREFEKL